MRAAKIHQPHGRPAAVRPTRRDDDRRPAHVRGYDHDWIPIRDRRRAENPFCQVCEAAGILIWQNVIIDHIEPVDERPDLRLDFANTQTLCRPCHRRKTDQDKRRAAGRAAGSAGRGRHESPGQGSP